MNEITKAIKQNPLGAITIAFSIVAAIVSSYVAFQLFQFSTNQRVNAIENTVSTLQASVSAQQTLINQLNTGLAVEQTSQSDMTSKINDISQDVKDIKNYLINKK